jgi:hypothetical protein
MWRLDFAIGLKRRVRRTPPGRHVHKGPLTLDAGGSSSDAA